MNNKKTMKRQMKVEWLLMTVIMIYATSCTDRLGFLDLENEAPEIGIEIVQDGQIQFVTELTDSLKTSLKVGKDTYNLKMNVSDFEQGSLIVDRTFKNGEAQLRLNGEDFTGPVDVSDVTELDLAVVPNENGELVIDFSLTDEIGKTGSVTFTLVSFNNLFPIANYTHSKIALHSSNQYEFDASDSFDQDERFGGRVRQYEWTINQNTFLREDAVFRQDLSPGGYDVSLVVIDNDGGRSEAFNKIITIN